MTVFVTQSFGNAREYKRAIFTILTYYLYIGEPGDKTQTLLFTDAPEYFTEYLKGLPVMYIRLTPAKIKIMRGGINFLHRMKISLIEEAFQKVKGNIIYADSDTFFIADPTTLINQLSTQLSFMHRHEYEFETLAQMPLPAGIPFRAFLQLIHERKFKLNDGASLHVAPDRSSWNAGVMMLHVTHQNLLPDIYALTDQFYPATNNHASEQYAFSIVLQHKTTVRSCESVIYHYWYRTKKQVADIFFDKRINDAWASRPLSQKLEFAKDWSMQLLQQFDTHSLILKDNAIQAFNENRFRQGYYYSWRALLKAPQYVFIKDVMYHTKRFILGKK